MVKALKQQSPGNRVTFFFRHSGVVKRIQCQQMQQLLHLSLL